MSDVQEPVPPVTPPPAAPAAPPAFDPQAAIASLQQQGYHVFAKDFAFDPAAQTENPLLKDVIGKTTSKIYADEDSEIYTQTGIAKNQGEKTYAYRNRAFAQLKDQLNAVPDVKAIRDEYENKLADAHKTVAEVSIMGAVRGLKLNASSDALNSMQELLTMRGLSLPHRTDGPNVIFQKFADDGKTLIDVIDATTGRPMETGKYLESYFKPFLAPVETPAQGPGKAPAQPDTGKPVPKTATEVAQQLQSEGFQIGSAAYNNELKARKTAYAITDSVTE